MFTAARRQQEENGRGDADVPRAVAVRVVVIGLDEREHAHADDRDGRARRQPQEAPLARVAGARLVAQVALPNTGTAQCERRPAPL